MSVVSWSNKVSTLIFQKMAAKFPGLKTTIGQSLFQVKVIEMKRKAANSTWNTMWLWRYNGFEYGRKPLA